LLLLGDSEKTALPILPFLSLVTTIPAFTDDQTALLAFQVLKGFMNFLQDHYLMPINYQPPSFTEKEQNQPLLF